MSNLSINTEVKADMKLEGEIKITVEGKSRPGNINNQNLEKEMMLINEFMTPNKEPGKTSAERDIGSTQLRKTIFKKHYT